MRLEAPVRQNSSSIVHFRHQRGYAFESLCVINLTALTYDGDEFLWAPEWKAFQIKELPPDNSLLDDPARIDLVIGVR